MVFEIEEFQFDDNASKHNVKEIISGKLYTQVEGFRPGNDDIVVDVGAGFGYYSVLCAKRHNARRVFAFEGLPENFRILLQNRERNSAMQIVPYNHTIGDRSGTMEWYRADSEVNNLGRGEYWQVETRTLDEIVMPDISLLKITAPGYGLDVLKGGMNRIIESHPRLILRIDSRDELLSVVKILKPLDYRLKEEIDNKGPGQEQEKYHRIQFYE